jgi:ATP-binding cassette, subfamily B, bacterial MsbA
VSADAPVQSTAPGVDPTIDNAQRLSQRLRRFFPYFGTLHLTWFWVGCAAVAGAATEPMIPALLKPLLDQGFQQGVLEIWVVPVALLLLFGVRGLAGYIAQVGLAQITNHGLKIMRRAMFDKILVAQLGVFKSQSSSALSNTVVYEVQTGSVMLVNSLLNIVRNGLTLIALTTYLFYLNWKLTLIVAAVFPAVAVVMRVLTRRLHRLTKANQEATDGLAYVVEENVLAHRDVRLYAAQSSQASRFETLSEALRGLAMKSTVAGAAMTPMTQMLAAVALSAVISVALVQSANNATSVGGFVAFVTAMLMIVAPIRQLSEVSSPLTRGLVALERGLDLIESTPSETEGSFAKEKALGDIEFKSVKVIYGDNTNAAVQSIDLHVKPGETVALVGSSGSGKSTLVNLLPRFVDATDGEILLDGEDVRNWNLTCLRAQMGYVSQHVVMLNSSLAQNVALGMPLDRVRVQAALDAANLTETVAALALGMDTVVGHNAMELSGGQRQRLAIARALYKDAPVLILDEATSALDSESEQSVQESLKRLMQNRTTLVIAHRLSTIRHANRIAVMDAGRIVEIGTHSELIAANGLYFRLHQLGFQGDVAATV